MILVRNNVLALRKQKKYTQEELAKKLGVTRQTIISIEQGKYIASLPLALKMSRLFGVPVDLIFYLEGDEWDGKNE